MHMTTETQDAVPGRKRRMRAPIVAAAAMVALFGGVACAPPSPSAGGGGIEINFGPLIIPLPPIEIRPAAVNVPLPLILGGICNASYQPPGIRIENATVAIPGVRIDPNNPIITIPNVLVTIPKLRLPLSTVTLSCLGALGVSVQPDAIIPSQVLFKDITLNLGNRTITFHDPSFTITGVGIAISPLPLGDIIIPLPPIVTIPFPSGAVAF